jgi:hypothetical protein
MDGYLKDGSLKMSNYGVQESPEKLINEFTTKMMMYHWISVTGLSFEKESFNKLSYSLLLKAKEPSLITEDMLKDLTTMATPVGLIRIEVDDE